MTKIGLIGTENRTGIGTQSAEFARHMRPEKVLVTDLTRLHAENSRNQKQVTNGRWFDDFERMTVDGIPDERACKWLLDGIDALFVIETPLNWDIFKWAREQNVRSYLQVNVEFFEYAMREVPKPDVFLMPTEWGKEYVETFGKSVYLPVPIATDRIKHRDITKAEKFIHVAGYQAFADRNGTEIVKSMNYPVTIHNQAENETDNYWDLYDDGDVLVLPRRYGGLSLVLQEATAAGMPVLVTEEDIYAKETCTQTIPGPYTHQKLNLRGTVDSHSASVSNLYETITALAQRESIADLSESAYEWAVKRSWEKLKPEYEKALSEV